MMPRNVISFAAPILLMMVGCGNLFDCIVKGDNVSGRLDFGTGIPNREDSRISVSWSKDNFVTTLGTTSVVNEHGLLVVPYSLCVDNNVDFQVKAVQRLAPQHDTIQSGDSLGRYDGTSNGNSEYKVLRINRDVKNKDDWPKLKDINMTLDSTEP